MTEKCGDCRFWEESGRRSVYSDEQWSEGFCRRYPPQFTKLKDRHYDQPSEEAHFAFPRMFDSQWCGEFQRQTEERSDTATAAD